MDADAAIRNGSRVLTLLALLSFLGWIATLQHLLLLASILVGVGAYGLFLLDRSRHPVDVGAGVGTDADDRVMEGADKAISPGVSAGGIHLSFETRTRWREKR